MVAHYGLGIEFAVALAIQSLSLFANSVDFLKDASVNFLILAVLGWSTRRRAKISRLLAGVLMIPGLGIFWTVWTKFQRALAPNPVPLSLSLAHFIISKTTPQRGLRVVLDLRLRAAEW